ncbi:MAG: hypothetical protein HUU26_10815 [Gemmatimonadaceae bacterium]|nr:hypothetical protein [Gemmatimonadaceae bacterium]
MKNTTLRAARAFALGVLFSVPAFAQGVAVRDLPKPSREIEDPFSMVGGAVEIRGGKVIAADAIEMELVVVDFAAGTRTPLGRQGSGPGEYRAPAGIMRLQGDTIWVLDAAQQRVVVFNPDLTPGTTFPLLTFDQSTMSALTAPFFNDRRGRIYASAMVIQAGTGGGDMQISLPDSVGLVRVEPRGSAGRTELAKLRFPVSGRPQISRAGNAMKYTMAYPGLVASDPWAVFPDGRIAVIRGADYSVFFIDADGKKSSPVRVPYEPIRVTAADQKAELDEARRQMAEQGKAAQKMMPAGFSMDFEMLPPASWPANYPPVSPLGALAAPDGRLWVKRATPFRVGREQWDVLDATGRLVARWRLPPRTSIVGVGQGVVYTARTDEDDLRYLQRVEVPK